MIAIIDYKAGKLTSVKRALDFLNIESLISDQKDVILNADHVIFPGVGHATSAMKNLKDLGLDLVIKDCYSTGKPFLGICLGTQIILSHTEEGDIKALDLIPGRTKHFSEGFEEDGSKIKIPHMGWNKINAECDHPVLKDVSKNSDFYFVHSYYIEPADQNDVLCTTKYGAVFASGICKDNLVAFQFHPEKSGPPGLQILKNFASWDGKNA